MPNPPAYAKATAGTYLITSSQRTIPIQPTRMGSCLRHSHTQHTLASLRSAQGTNTNQLPKRFTEPTKIIITKREKTSLTPQGDDAEQTAARYRGSIRCADRYNPRPAGSGLFRRVGDRYQTSIRSRAASLGGRRPGTWTSIRIQRAGSGPSRPLLTKRTKSHAKDPRVSLGCTLT
jgi:hypothetical protein